MIYIVETTFASKEQAEKIATTIVKRKLAACCHIIPIFACYEWKGEVAVEDEVILKMKTLDTVFPQLLSFLEKNHPYETPEVLAFRAEHSSKKYLSWVTSTLTS